MSNLKDGFLSGITQAVVADKDLDLHIRDNYLNVYYKGNSLLKLSESNEYRYIADIHPKFLGGMSIPDLTDQGSTDEFIKKIPAIKDNIIHFGKSSLEIEYEQLIIRANNNEMRNNTEYFIVDRQYTLGRDRIDLMGMFWPRAKRRQGQIVSPCVIEVKFALNTDISEVHNQLNRYYQLVKENASEIAEDLELSFRQRLELGLYEQHKNRVAAMKTLGFSRDINQFQFILILVDYNPFSSIFDISRLATLPFTNQIKVFSGGFAMWEKELISVNS
jgi:hypothetical protein